MGQRENTSTLSHAATLSMDCVHIQPTHSQIDANKVRAASGKTETKNTWTGGVATKIPMNVTVLLLAFRVYVNYHAMLACMSMVWLVALVHQLAAHNRVLSIREHNVNTAKSTEERVHITIPANTALPSQPLPSAIPNNNNSKGVYYGITRPE